MPPSVGGPKWQMGRLYSPSLQLRERATPRPLANGLHLPATSRIQAMLTERKEPCGAPPIRALSWTDRLVKWMNKNKWISVSRLMWRCQNLLCKEVSQQVGLDPLGVRIEGKKTKTKNRRNWGYGVNGASGRVQILFSQASAVAWIFNEIRCCNLTLVRIQTMPSQNNCAAC